MLRFIDGFDGYATGDLNKRWSSTNGDFSVVSGGRFGGNALRCSSGGGGFQIKVIDSQQFWYIGFAYKMTTLAGSLYSILNLYSSGTTQISLGLDSSGRLCLQRSGAALTGCTGTTALSGGAWYYIELAIKVGTSAAAGDAKVYLGGVQEISCPSTTNLDPAGSGLADRFGLGTSFPNGSNIFFWDDVYVCDHQGTVNNGVLGDMRVELLLPDGAGNYQNFAKTGTPTTHYQCVNENPNDGDTSYVSSATPGDYETFTFGNLSNTPKTIAGIQITAVTRKDDAGTRSISHIVRQATTDYVATPTGVIDSYAFNTTIMETSPSTSAAWTATEINAMEAGVKLVS